MEKELQDKLNQVLRDLETLNKNLITIFKELRDIESRLYKSESKEFVRNLVADIAGTIIAELGLIDLIKSIKGEKI